MDSDRYAMMLDLLGGKGFLDIDSFDHGTDEAQSDLRNPNRIVTEGERFRYNYRINAKDISTFLRFDYRAAKLNAFMAAGWGMREYQSSFLPSASPLTWSTKSTYRLIN